MSVECTSIRNVAVQLRSLSADPENQPIIAREEGCMAALVGFIEGTDPDIVRIAVDAVLDLTSHPENAEVLKQEKGLVPALRALVTDFDRADFSTRQSAHACLVNLLVTYSKESHHYIAEDLALLAAKGGLGGKDNFVSCRSSPLKAKRQSSITNDSRKDKADEFPFLPQTLTVRLHVENVSDEDVQFRVERLLVMTKGIVSVSFEIGTETVVVRSRIAAEHVRKAIELRGGFKAEILDEEVYVDKENNRLFGSNENASNLSNSPKYLDEMPSRSRLSWSWQRGDRIIVPGNVGVTLAERLEAQRKEEARKRTRASRLVNRIGKGFISGFGFW
eukprot:jgi/Galph1/4013/GphlegSOOS_G2658.1